MSLEEKRKRIAEVDDIIVGLIEERTKIGKEIARIKDEIEDSDQEKKVIQRAQEKTDVDVSGVFREIIELTKEEMRNDT